MPERFKFPIYMEDCPSYEIRADQMHIIWRDLEIVLPVNTMLAGMAQAKREIDKWCARSATVVPFGKRA